MSEPVYSVNIASYKGIGSLTAPIGPGAGYKWVIRCMDFYCGPNVSVPELLVEGTDGQTFFYATGSATDPSYNSWRGRQVIGPAGTIRFNVMFGTWDITVSGYLLTLP